MTGASIFALIVLSLAGLGYLAATDPKRRRIFKQSKIERRPFAWPARIATFAPGLYLTIIGHWSGLSIWAGAVTTVGWAMVAIQPDRYYQARVRFFAVFQQATARVVPYMSVISGALVSVANAAWNGVTTRVGIPFTALRTHGESSSAGGDTIVLLEARIAELEHRLATLEKTTSQSEAPTPDEESSIILGPHASKKLDAAE
ncbi:MAG: hypothetical protein AAF681_01820 [Pseudomonadota bacterium]